MQFRFRCYRNPDLDAIMALAPVTRDRRRSRKRYGKLRGHLFTFLDHPGITADTNSSERELRPTATYRKVTGGFRSGWGADLFAGVRSVIGTAKRRGIDAYQAIHATLRGQSAVARVEQLSIWLSEAPQMLEAIKAVARRRDLAGVIWPA
jgi:hypothetical protein